MFFVSTGANATIKSIGIQPNGKIIIGGVFSSYNKIGRNAIAGLNADGTLDASFNPGTGANSTVETTAIQADGKIIIGGYFTSYNGTARNRIARLNVDGSLDASFNPGTGVTGVVLMSAIQADGKIIIGGAFFSYNGTARNAIARLNVDGSLDASFNPGTGAHGNVYGSAIQPDGKIIIGGSFNSYNGTAINRIARLNTDGSLDATFDVGTGVNNSVWSIVIQPDGKIIIGGLFTSYNGTERNGIARLNADGSLDSSFNPGTGTNGGVEMSAIQPDGKIIIGGSFTSYNGTERNGIARLNVDGSLDASFNPGTGVNVPPSPLLPPVVNSIAFQPDGNIIIGGYFSEYNGTGRTNIARVLSEHICQTVEETDIISSC